MFAYRGGLALVVAAVVAVTLPMVGTGCNSGTVEVDRAANYTPDSLADELIFRYRALSVAAKTATYRGSDARSKSGKGASAPAVSKKSVTRSTKKKGANTIDDVLEDIDSKIDLISGTPRVATKQQMVEKVSRDPSLRDTEKQELTELIGRLGDQAR